MAQPIYAASVPDPTIEEARDAIIKATTCAICGSDLHLIARSTDSAGLSV
jgi:threonine dehydrogenase-like Zn-dependent dehydrogenase